MSGFNLVNGDRRSNVVWGDRDIFRAIRCDNKEEVQDLLLECPNRIFWQDKFGNTPLHIAVQSGKEEIALLLLRRGARRDVVNKFGKTPGHLAIAKKNLAMAEVL